MTKTKGAGRHRLGRKGSLSPRSFVLAKDLKRVLQASLDGAMSGTDLGEEGPSARTTCFLFLKDGEPEEFGNVTLLPALSTEVFRLRGEVEALKDKLDLANQERTSLVRDFFPQAIERFLSSDHFISTLIDLLEKVMLVGKSQALREVASSDIGVELVDMKDFDPNAKQNYDTAIESFYQVKFPYVDHLIHYAGESVGKLMTLKPLIIPFGKASAAGIEQARSSRDALYNLYYPDE
uniref:Uncharacterized protein n=1 Tax=Tanacetum cinerariifolium TaxID=118510 RepID=A0A699KU82_TANCI|nr:hypothetical protein [Tanacetum cinerariifolium]